MLSRDIGRKLSAQSLMAGARAPGYERRWPSPHHGNRRVHSTIVNCVRQARQDYLHGRYHEAAFQLGVASHFALDIMVPHRAPSKEHAVCESRFAQVDHNMHYYREEKKTLADGRLAERSIGLLIRTSHSQPIDFQHRLQVAYLCMQRVIFAVTEEAEPLEIVNQSTEAFVRLASDLEEQLMHYRELVEGAFGQRLSGSWNWELPDAKETRLDVLCRNEVAVHDLLRANGCMPLPHTMLMNRLALWRFRRKLLADLDDMLRWKRGSRHLRGRCASIARRYKRAAARIQERANHWNWFNAEWDFWSQKGELGLKYILLQARRTRQRPVAEEERSYRRECMQAFQRSWSASWRDRIDRFFQGNWRAKVRLYAIPNVVLAGLMVCLVVSGVLSPTAGGAIGVLSAAGYLLYAHRALHSLRALGALARGDQHPPATDEATDQAQVVQSD